MSFCTDRFSATRFLPTNLSATLLPVFFEVVVFAADLVTLAFTGFTAAFCFFTTKDLVLGFATTFFLITLVFF
jgi:hypothetical protein